MLTEFLLNKKARLIAAVVAALFIIGFPVFQICRYENVLAKGKTIKIKCRAYDPYDPFRGRYVRCRLETQVDYLVDFPKDDNPNNIFIRNGYVLIDVGHDGYIQFKEVVRKRPKKGNYVRCRAHRYYNNNRSEKARTTIILTGLDRYYMNEKLAPKAEKALIEALRDEQKTCHLEIKLLNGLAVPTQLYIEDQPIEEYVK